MVELHLHKRPIIDKVYNFLCNIKLFCRFFIGYTMIFYGVTAFVILISMQYYVSAAVSSIVPIIGFVVLFGIKTCAEQHRNIDF